VELDLDRHAPWTPQIEAFLQVTGATKKLIDRIRAYQEARCKPPETSGRLRASPRVQAVLFGWGVTPQETLELVEYLDMLTDQRHKRDGVPSEVRSPEVREKDRKQKQQWRGTNKADYNEYQREYMKKRRAAQKAAKKDAQERTEAARLLRWPDASNENAD
jgi:hypothetical protein